MNEFIKTIRSDRIMEFSFFVSISIFVLSVLLILLFYSRLPPLIPLFNQMPWGETRLSLKQDIFIPPIITLFVFITNFSLAYFLYEKMPLLSRILCTTSLLICLLSLLLIIRTIQIIV